MNWKVSQKEVIKNTLDWKNILTIFPTGWWKSITFQLPAIIEAEMYWDLTLIISPLVSLMKDQVDSLEKKWIANSWYINWLLTPIERKNTIDRISDGKINLLYLAPETLRSQSIKRLLQTRNINRVVIDEAHCFSKWWHDFRTDYMFIWPFIKELNNHENIKISCFTATAKHDVIEDIKHYFKDELNKYFIEHIWEVKRNNLNYEVLKVDDEKNRFEKLVDLLKNRVEDKVAIIFVRTTKSAEKLSEKLNNCEYSFNTTYYHWKMDKDDKWTIQENFISGLNNIIIATNAFWMWVDKSDVRYVIHYEISSSIENYIQEAWRAWRDGEKSTCVILYNKSDLDKDFRLIKQSELDKKEISDLLRVIKNNKFKSFFIWSKELVRLANIESEFDNADTIVKTALYILEKTWFIKRWFNKTRIFATSKELDDIKQWYEIIDNIININEKDKQISKEILKHIFSDKQISIEEIALSISNHFPDEVNMRQVIKKAENLISIMREEKLLEKIMI